MATWAIPMHLGCLLILAIALWAPPGEQGVSVEEIEAIALGQWPMRSASRHTKHIRWVPNSLAPFCDRGDSRGCERGWDGLEQM